MSANEDDLSGMKGAADYFEKKLKYAYERNKMMADRQEKMLRLEHQLLKQRRLMEVATRAGTGIGGGVMGNAMGFMQQLAGMKLGNLSRLNELKGAETKRILSPDEAKERDTLGKEAGLGALGKVDKLFNKHFGQGSRWDKAFGGHGKEAAGGLALGGIGAGMALGKMIIDSSPMMQQMFKLWKFGIMLILKPIGDFFGFLFRPILLILLRKFIIPNYQKLMPKMIQMGTDIGNMVAGWLNFVSGDWFTKLDWGAIANTALKILFPAYGIASVIADHLAKNPIDWDSVMGNVKAVGATINNAVLDTVGKVFGEDAQAKLEKFQDFMGTIATNTLTMGWNKIKGFFEAFSKDPLGTLRKNFENIMAFFNALANNPLGTIRRTIRIFFATLKKLGIPQEVIDGIKNFGSNVKAVIDGIIGALLSIPRRIWSATMNVGKMIYNAFADIVNGIIGIINDKFGFLGFKPIPTLTKMAQGGIINEPVMGVGQRSGKGYLLGEAGAERVTPLGKGGDGTTVNIHIGNMSGDIRDVQKLRKVILEVMQNVNTNRGR